MNFAKRFHLLSLFLMLLAAPISAQEILVLNSPGEVWEQSIRSRISQVNRFLGDHFQPIPQSVRVARTHGTPEYDLKLKLLLLDEAYIPVELFHEYAHALLDSFLLERSAAIQYYQLRKQIRDADVTVKISELQADIEDDSRYLLELRERGYTRMEGNLTRTLQESRLLLAKLEASRPIDRELKTLYSLYTSKTIRPSLYRVIAPYHELFADTLATMVTGQWESIYMTQLDAIENDDFELEFSNKSPTMDTASYLQYRSFKAGINLKSYRFSDMEQQSTYTQFAPARSYIRHLTESSYATAKADLLSKLATAIAEEIENRLRNPQHYEMSLREQNRRLIGKLAAVTDIDHW
ncbi:hypothetical protein QKW35_14905 [Pontibacterium granulatum]|uniref:hypothetical protein n=1 Tax=Pontibacterium granulatum TaxID=2036029 RepID=UPI00249BD382|nr:hypothetical protein [Pontibacterium granulatum]MDI3325666.1 hypothetical protein [Pontibacterium granulatum]